MNLNDIARQLTEDEGGAISMSIAQVKEVLKLINQRCGKQFYPWVKQNFHEVVDWKKEWGF